MTSQRKTSLLWVSLLLGGCSAEPPSNTAHGDSSLEICDPLASVDSAPVELGEVVGIGRAEDGTVYLVDEFDADLRLFVSEGEVLQRYEVDGSGQSTNGGATSVSVSVQELGLLLQIDTDEEGNTRIGLLLGANDARELVIGEDGEELEVLDLSDIDDMSLSNLPGDIFVEYWAKAEDGQFVLVTRPDTDWDYEDFRLFLGPSERVAERSVTSVLRQRDGGTTTIEFTAEGTATAYFPTPSREEPSTLTLNGEQMELSLLSNDPADANAQFYCR